MSTTSRDEHAHDWTHYPVDHLAAVLRDGREAERAALALRDAGFADVVVFAGPQALRAIEATERRANPLTRAWERLSIQLSDEADARRGALEALREGHAIVLVYVADGTRRDQAEGILKAHQAGALRFFGRWTITDLSG
jgi:hypothetical protein